LFVTVVADRGVGGGGTQSAQDMPAGEQLQQLPVLGMGEGRQPVAEPGFERQQVAVSGGEYAVVHQQITQVSHGSGGLQLVEHLVGEFSVVAGEGPQ
jgi:hypothetical protein